MQEFETISASSYDPSALAAKLTAKAAEGWSVVAIVPTGGDVTAFLSRGGTASTAAGSSTAAAASTAAVAAAAPADAASSTEVAATETEAETKAETKAETEGAVETPAAVSEPSGWALAPEPATPTIAEPTIVQPTASYEPSTSHEPAASTSFQPTLGGGAASPAPAAAPAAEPAPAAAPAVPAGWYADPAGRFELRYWDGGTWTEHVSRAGQQFTDPPVA